MKRQTITGIMSGCILAALSTSAIASYLPFSVTGGYAQSTVTVNDERAADHPRGANLKAGYEFDGTWGIMSSVTFTRMSVNDVDVNYTSLAAGPSFRLNDKVSFYALAGGQWSKAHCHERIEDYCIDDYSRNGMVGAVGMQFNPLPEVAIDASYEYSKVRDLNIATWVIGLGGRF